MGTGGRKKAQVGTPRPSERREGRETERRKRTDAADARPIHPPACAARDMCVAGPEITTSMRGPLALLRERERENEREKKKKRNERESKERKERNTK
jgi:hypothetical protein